MLIIHLIYDIFVNVCFKIYMQDFLLWLDVRFVGTLFIIAHRIEILVKKEPLLFIP